MYQIISPNFIKGVLARHIADFATALIHFAGSTAHSVAIEEKP